MLQTLVNAIWYRRGDESSCCVDLIFPQLLKGPNENMLLASSRKQSTLPKAEVMMLLLVIRTGHRFSSSHFLATKQKQSWAAHSDTPWQSLIKSVQSPEHKLPFCGHRCLLDHCGTKREMNVKLSVMPLASIYCFGVQMSWHQCQLICTS